MSDLNAYCVALFFEGTTRVAMTVAGSEAEAMAHVSVQAAREHDHPLLGVGMLQLEPEWMRYALKTLESGEPHKASVVSLVPQHPLRLPRRFCSIHPAICVEEDGVSSPCRFCNPISAKVPRCLEHGSAIPCPACLAEQRERYRHLMPMEAPDPA